MTDESRGAAKQPGTGRRGGGDSGGGAYPNPHAGKKPGNDGYMGHGGQTEQPYHGGDQLGEESVGTGRSVNSTTRGTGKKDDDRAS